MAFYPSTETKLDRLVRVDYLESEGARRRISAETLVDRLIEKIVADRLVNPVMDDVPCGP